MDETVSDVFRSIEATPEGLSTDESLGVLADRQRRHLLATLHGMETPERLSSLTRNIAIATDRSGDYEIEKLHVRLYHSHVPKLEAAGLVSYDADADTVELTEQGRTLAAKLDR